jgi:hypothetical protein
MSENRGIYHKDVPRKIKGRLGDDGHRLSFIERAE